MADEAKRLEHQRKDRVYTKRRKPRSEGLTKLQAKYKRANDKNVDTPETHAKKNEQQMIFHRKRMSDPAKKKKAGMNRKAKERHHTKYKHDPEFKAELAATAARSRAKRNAEKEGE